MEATTLDRERRKQVKIRLRPDLVISRRSTRAAPTTSSRTRSACATTASRSRSTSCSQLMDGKHTLDEAQKAFEERFRPDRLTLEDLEALRPAAPHGRAGPERVAAGRQAALRAPPASASRSEWLQTLHQHPLHQDPGLRPGQAADADAAVPAAGSSRPGSSLLSVGVHAGGRHAGADPLRDLPRQAAALPRVLQLQDGRSTCGSPWASSRSSTSSATA